MPHAESGYGMVELIVALALLVVGMLSGLAAIDSARILSLIAERQTTLASRAQQELERIQTLPYNRVAMTGAPSHSSNPREPTYYVMTGTPTTFQYDRLNSGATEGFVVDAAIGAIPSTPTAWTDGNMSGFVYDFVTAVADPNCSNGGNCPAAGDYKRITVAITLTGATHPNNPTLISTLISDPNSAATGYVVNGVQNPLVSPSTQCLDASSVLVPCTNGLSAGNANTWFLSDTSLITTTGGGLFSSYNSARQTIGGSHATHPTVAVVNALTCVALAIVTGCQNPDRMGSSPPPQDGPAASTPYCYSSDSGCSGTPYPGHPVGGKTLAPDVPCSAANPWSTTDNHKGAYWSTDPLAVATTLTGSGGMTLYAATSSGATASVTLCIGVYVTPTNILGLLAVPPVRVGVVSYSMASFPAIPTPVSFNFDLLAAGTTYAVLANSRLGVRVWVSSTSSTGVTLVYDHPQFQSAMQLNSQ